MRGERFKDVLERSGPYDLELLGVSRWMRVVTVKVWVFLLGGYGFYV